nr:MarR family transcriptional regulator [Haloimpatiens massiliensis]
MGDNPGTTVTELSKYWNRTKGAISKTVSRLVERGFVTRYQKEDNAKTILLKVTEEGLKLSQAHKLYDTIDIAKTLDDLLKKCTIEDIDSFYKVIDTYIELIKKDFK